MDSKSNLGLLTIIKHFLVLQNRTYRLFSSFSDLVSMNVWFVFQSEKRKSLENINNLDLFLLKHEEKWKDLVANKSFDVGGLFQT